MALGILGGTFNPPHLGHVAIARAALAELALERVLLMPAHIPPHKPHEQDPGPQHRLRMCELAASEADGLAACGLELERAGPSYTVDTLSALHAHTPRTRLTFILGADIACAFGSWREPRKILELADIAVAERAGAPRERVLDALAELAPTASAGAGESQPRVRFLQVAPIEVSSSEVRARVAAGEPVQALVGTRVAGYIAEHGLYRGEQAAAR